MAFQILAPLLFLLASGLVLKRWPHFTFVVVGAQLIVLMHFDRHKLSLPCFFIPGLSLISYAVLAISNGTILGREIPFFEGSPFKELREGKHQIRFYIYLFAYLLVGHGLLAFGYILYLFKKTYGV